MFYKMLKSFWLFSMLLPIMFYADGGGGDGGGGDGGEDGDPGEGDGGGESPGPLDNWYNDIEESYATDPSISRFKDQPIGEVLKSFINAKKMVGADKIALPGENATPEELNEFYKSLGRPDAHNEYELAIPDDVPKGMRYSKTFADNFSKAAHEAGIPKNMAGKMWSAMSKTSMDVQSRANADLKVNSEEAIRGLKNEWGSAYSQKMDLGKKAARVIAKATGTDFDKYIETNNAQMDPVVAKALAFMGEQFSEDQIGTATGEVAMTNREAKAEINELMADPAYFDKKNPKHKMISDKVKRLHQIVYPEEG